jgi:hypothetical protein
MDHASIFDWVADALERRTELTRLEARGTVRIALRDAGLEPATVTPRQMEVTLTQVLPGLLARRGVEGHEALCSDMVLAFREFTHQSSVLPTESAYDVFRRLGGD